MHILIVDDHPLIREGLANVLAELDSSAQILEAANASDALAQLASDRNLALALLDLALPGVDGLSLLEQVRATRPDVPVVVLSATDNRAVVLAAIEMGAMGFISKRSQTRVLVNALRLVLAGGVYVPPEALDASGSLAEASKLEPAKPDDKAATLASLEQFGLTDRQAAVLALIIEGKPNKLICRELDLAEGTVKTHISAILRALDVANRTQAVYKLATLGVRIPGLAIGSRPPLPEED
jgi:DNA-binding NarL/FixJ family response regulator